MSLFRPPKFPPPQDIRIPDQWDLRQGEYQGKPLIVRLRTAAKSFAGHPAYPHQVGIAVPLRNPDSRGFPAADEAEALNRIEDAISEDLQVGNESLLIGVISTNGMREYVFYTRDPKGVGSKVEAIGKRFLTHTIQMMIQPDRQWRVFTSLLA